LLFLPNKPRTLKAREITDIEGSKVRMEGLEPPRLSAPDPKSGTATNYATSAKRRGKFIDNSEIRNNLSLL
jgi:hypothetical protein